MVPLWQKKSVWQVTTIIQPALCHLVTSHFQEIACNWTPKDQIRWPIFLMLLCMIVLTEKTSKFPQPIIFWILVFSCHKMTLITKITWMPQILLSIFHMAKYRVQTIQSSIKNTTFSDSAFDHGPLLKRVHTKIKSWLDTDSQCPLHVREIYWRVNARSVSKS